MDLSQIAMPGWSLTDRSQIADAHGPVPKVPLRNRAKSHKRVASEPLKVPTPYSNIVPNQFLRRLGCARIKGVIPDTSTGYCHVTRGPSVIGPAVLG